MGEHQRTRDDHTSMRTVAYCDRMAEELLLVACDAEALLTLALAFEQRRNGIRAASRAYNQIAA